MIIRRRLLEAEPSIIDDQKNGTLVGMARKEDFKELEAKFNKAYDPEEKCSYLDTAVWQMVYDRNKAFKDQFEAFRKLPLKVRYEWIESFGFENLKNKLSPFLELLRSNNYKLIFTNRDSTFLKCYNITLKNIKSINQVKKSKDENIIFYSKLYQSQDWDEIAKLYYDYLNNEKIKDAINNNKYVQNYNITSYNDIFLLNPRSIVSDLRPITEIKDLIRLLSGTDIKNKRKSVDEITSKDEVSDELKDVVTKISKNAKQKEYVLKTLQQK